VLYCAGVDRYGATERGNMALVAVAAEGLFQLFYVQLNINFANDDIGCEIDPISIDSHRFRQLNVSTDTQRFIYRFLLGCAASGIWNKKIASLILFYSWFRVLMFRADRQNFT
jgi:hypothetical protein